MPASSGSLSMRQQLAVDRLVGLKSQLSDVVIRSLLLCSAQ